MRAMALTAWSVGANTLTPSGRPHGQSTALETAVADRGGIAEFAT